MRPPREPKGVKVYGLFAARAVLEHRLDEVIRVHVAQTRLAELSPELKRCAERRLPYHVVEGDDLERLTGSVHHEGVCVLVRPQPLLPPSRIAARIGPAGGHILVLHALKNPHNLGAILRVAAHFGTRGAIVTGEATAPPLGGATSRLAEGGSLSVPVGYDSDVERVLGALRRRRIAILATASEAGEDLYRTKIPRRAALVFGPEREGLPESVLAAADAVVTIPGTGVVDSLNVSCAVAVLTSELWRRRSAEALRAEERGEPPPPDAPTARPVRRRRRTPPNTPAD